MRFRLGVSDWPKATANRTSTVAEAATVTRRLRPGQAIRQRGAEISVISTRDREELETLARDMRRKRPRAASALKRVLTALAAGSDAELLTTTQVAAFMSVSDQTIRNWVDRGWLPSRRRLHGLGRRMIPRKAIEGLRAFDQVRLDSRLSEDDAVELVRAHRRERARSKVGSRT